MQTLPAPKVLGWYLDEAFDPPMPAAQLYWDRGAADLPERLWDLPEGVCLAGPGPECFGLTVGRKGAHRYAVRLLWDRTCFTWPALTRVQVLTSALVPLLKSLGFDVARLLDQPLGGEVRLPRQACAA